MDLVLALGLLIAALAWAALFTLDRAGFWPRAAAAGALIGAFALAAERTTMVRALRPTVTDVAIGVAGAALLWVAFWVGEQALAAALPRLSAEVADLYAIRAETTARSMPLVLCVIGPGEELFWRGFVQHRAGIVVALVAYALVHVWERKPVLILAALLGGGFWGALNAWRGTLVAPVVSHVLWDLAIIVWFPVKPLARWRR